MGGCHGVLLLFFVCGSTASDRVGFFFVCERQRKKGTVGYQTGLNITKLRQIRLELERNLTGRFVPLVIVFFLSLHAFLLTLALLFVFFLLCFFLFSASTKTWLFKNTDQS